MSRTMPSLVLDTRTIGDRRMGAMAVRRRDLARLAGRIRKIVQTVEDERRDGEHRYRDLPFDLRLRRQIEALADTLRPRTENLVVLGIGGSALGNIALHQALRHPQYNLLSRRARGGPRLFVMDNVDPAHFAAMLEIVKPDLRRTLFNVISKSGETAETASQFLVVRDLLRRRLGPEAARRQIVAITDPQSGTLRTLADAEGYHTLPVPEGVGGRFSVLSAVGLFSAAMTGIDIKLLLKGAADADRQVRQPNLMKNPAALIAAINHVCYQRGQVMAVMMAYSNALYGLADWFRQLWAESLGKTVRRRGQTVHVGPTPIKALGTTDQHSQVQLYREGPNDKLITFLEVEAFEQDVRIAGNAGIPPALQYLTGQTMSRLLAAEKRATELALLRSQRPCITVRFPRIDPYYVGQFLYVYEAATTIAGRLLGVDPYDQPGVELGKRITYHLMGKKGYGTMPAE